MTDEFEVRDIPRRTRKTGGLWKAVAGALRANPGKAVFVPADSKKLQKVRTSGYSQLHRYLGGVTVRSEPAADGVYFWIDPVAKEGKED